MIESYDTDRETIARAARDAIASVRESYEVPTALVRKLMKVARTAPQFTLGEWRLGECGCLIGNLYGEGFDLEQLPLAEYRVGLAFDTYLRLALHARAYGVVTVRS